MSYDLTLIRKVARETGVPVETARKIIYSQFEYYASVVKSGTNEQILAHHLGRWKVKPNRLKQLKYGAKKFKEIASKEFQDRIERYKTSTDKV